jgi:tRNA dimethylallyltransferase
VGLVVDSGELARRIDARAETMLAAGAAAEARQAVVAGASRTARAALGFEEILTGDVEAMQAAHRAYARRQVTWLRRMREATLIDRTGRSDADVAAEIVALLD